MGLTRRFYGIDGDGAGGGIASISGGDHSTLSGLDYSSSGHTGFAPDPHTITGTHNAVDQPLVDGSNADSLHTHTNFSGATFVGDTTYSGNIYFGDNIISGTGDIYANYFYGTFSGTLMSGGDHSVLTNLDYASSGHTGFAPDPHTIISVHSAADQPLVDGSNADSLHTHSTFSGATFIGDTTYSGNVYYGNNIISGTGDIYANNFYGTFSGTITSGTIDHDDLANVLPDQHHTELHTIASHSDTSATGPELDTLTDGSNADFLHTHTSFSGATFSGNVYFGNNIISGTYGYISDIFVESGVYWWDGFEYTRLYAISPSHLYFETWDGNITLEVPNNFIITGDDVIINASGSGFVINGDTFYGSNNISGTGDIYANNFYGNFSGTIASGTVDHDDLANVTPNQHHSELHTIASHSDTSATGPELDTLTDGSNADSLHTHTSFSGATFDGTTTFNGDIDFGSNIISGTGDIYAGNIYAQNEFITNTEIIQVQRVSDDIYIGDTLTVSGSSYFEDDIYYGANNISGTGDIYATNFYGNFSGTITSGTVDHDDLSNVTPNQHHNELHTIVSHSDTTATGPELDTLTDGSNADSLHTHTSFSGATFEGDTIFNGDIDYGNNIISGTGDIYATNFYGTFSGTVTSGTLNHDELNNLDYNSSGHIGFAAQAIHTDSNEPTGFVNRTDSNITFVSGTRTFTISGASYDYYIQGVKYTKSGSESYQIDDTEGLVYIYYDGPTLTGSTTYTPDIILNKAYVAVIYWDADNDVNIYFGEERHGITMDGATHLLWHTIFGTSYYSGLALININANSFGYLDSSAQFGYTGGRIYDEDILHTISGASKPAQIPVFYREGPDGDWRKAPVTDFPILTYSGGNNRMAWNEDVGGTWQQTEVDHGDYALCHIFATNGIDEPIIAIQGQSEYDDIASARQGATVEINNIVPSGLPFAEFTPLGTVIYQSQDNYTNTVKSRIRSTDEGEDYIDWRNFTGGPTGSINDHGNLSGLSDDDHSQYLRSDGTRALTGDWAYGSNNISGTGDIYATNFYGNFVGDGSGISGVDHDNLSNVTANQHHNELHTIVSHSDTSATGPELDTLTDGSDADSLHYHKYTNISGTVPSGALPPHTHTESDITDLDHDAIKIQGRTVYSGAPNDGDIFVWNDSQSRWEPAATSTGVAPHTIQSHIDTNATGAQLNTLTDGSNADSLHTHTSFSGATFSGTTIFNGDINFGDNIISGTGDIYANNFYGTFSGTITSGTIDHDELTNVTPNQHHDELHTIASHSDTSATGPELDTLTDGSNADSLHTHTTFSGATFYGNTTHSGNIYFGNNIISGTYGYISDVYVESGIYWWDGIEYVRLYSINPSHLYFQTWDGNITLETLNNFIITGDDVIINASGSGLTVNGDIFYGSNNISGTGDIYATNFYGNFSGTIASGTVDHDDLANVTPNQHHSELHTIVSHSDTSATGPELDTLTDGSNADSLHTHTSFSGATFEGNTTFNGDINFGNNIISGTGDLYVNNIYANNEYITNTEIIQVQKISDDIYIGDTLTVSGSSYFEGDIFYGANNISGTGDIYATNFYGNFAGTIVSGTVDHDDLANVTADQHHNELHTIVSHSDTDATGSELNTLTDGSNADSLHTHTNFSGATFEGDTVFNGNIFYGDNIISGTGDIYATNFYGTFSGTALSGTVNHNELNNLDYSVAGHTGFVSIGTTQTVTGSKTFTQTITTNNTQALIPSSSGTEDVGSILLPYDEFYGKAFKAVASGTEGGSLILGNGGSTEASRLEVFDGGSGKPGYIMLYADNGVAYYIAINNSGGLYVDDSVPSGSGVSYLTFDSTGITTNGNIYVSGDVLPTISGSSDLGSASKPFMDLYLEGGSIYIGGVKLEATVIGNQFIINTPTVVSGNVTIPSGAGIFTGDGSGLYNIDHSNLSNVNPNDHHNELHTIASHSDTSATGPELDTLTDGSNADVLHYHNYTNISGTLPSGALPSHMHSTGDIIGLQEYVEDTAGNAITGTGTVTVTYNDGTGTITVSGSPHTDSISGSDHSVLSNLDYASSGHTGFAPDQHTITGTHAAADQPLVDGSNADSLHTHTTFSGATFYGDTIFNGDIFFGDNIISGTGDLYVNNIYGTFSGTVASGTIDHDHLSNVTADQHHSELHTIVSHSDTDATGAELNTLTDGSSADSLHYHDYTNISGTVPSGALPAHTHIEADITDLDHDAVKLQGYDISTTAPSDGEVLAWNDSSNEWEPSNSIQNQIDTLSSGVSLIRFSVGEFLLTDDKPSLADNNGCIGVLLFHDGSTKQAFNSFEVPTNYASGTDINIEIHYMTTKDQTGDTNCVWAIDYQSVDEYDVVSTGTVSTIYTVDSVPNNALDNTFLVANLTMSGTDSNNPLAIGKHVFFRLYRDTDHASDTLDSDAAFALLIFKY
jgi:hypothetical protein